jgi:hypothetical protein
MTELPSAVFDHWHNMVHDPGRYDRYTCAVCGRAVVRSDNGFWYGSALDKDCDR